VARLQRAGGGEAVAAVAEPWQVELHVMLLLFYISTNLPAPFLVRGEGRGWRSGASCRCGDSS
jgi:hypothetical protein